MKVIWNILPVFLILLSSASSLLKDVDKGLYLTPWFIVILLLFFFSLYQYVSMDRGRRLVVSAVLVVSIVIITNIAAQLIGQSLKALYYPLAVLIAFFFPVITNIIAVLSAVFLESSNLFFSNPSQQDISHHITFIFTISMLAILSNFLFKKERKVREEVSKAFENLKEKAEVLNPFDGTESNIVLEAMSDPERFDHLVASAIGLEKDLHLITKLIRKLLSAHSVCLFIPDKEGALTLKAFDSETEYVLSDKKIEVGKGYVGWIGKERVILNISELKGRYEALGFYGRDIGIKSFIGIPLFDHGLFIGILVADSLKESAFSNKEEEILEVFGIQVVQLLKKAKLDQQIEVSARGAKILHEISSSLSSTLNLKEMGEKLIELSSLIVTYDHGGILLYNEGKKEMELLVAKNWDGLEEGSRFPAEKSLVGWIAQNRQPLIFSDLKDTREKFPIAPDISITVRSFLGLPLNIKGEKVIGVFALSSKEPDKFTAYQQYLLSIICNQMAVLITNAKLHYEMEMMAITDGLTGLLNHRRFQEKFLEEFRRIERHPEPLSLILADIDHFKRVNDEYGHPTGDEILKKVAAVLKKMVRDIDVVARYGGEEFAIILINTDGDGAYKLAERIRKAVEKKTFTFGPRRIPITISMGISSYPRDGKAKEDILSRADEALYRAKDEGRNRCCLYKR